jgi:hypothetical protein
VLLFTYRPKGPKEREKVPKRIDRAYVTRRAKKLNCVIEEIGGDIILTAPSGYKLYSETHYSGWELAHYSKAEIWDDFADQLTRLVPCGCGC